MTLFLCTPFYSERMLECQQKHSGEQWHNHRCKYMVGHLANTRQWPAVIFSSGRMHRSLLENRSIISVSCILSLSLCYTTVLLELGHPMVFAPAPSCCGHGWMARRDMMKLLGCHATSAQFLGIINQLRAAEAIPWKFHNRATSKCLGPLRSREISPPTS